MLQGLDSQLVDPVVMKRRRKLIEPKKSLPSFPAHPRLRRNCFFLLASQPPPSSLRQNGPAAEASNAARTASTTCLLVNDAKLQHLSRATLDSSRQHRVKAALLSDIYSANGYAKEAGE